MAARMKYCPFCASRVVRGAWLDDGDPNWDTSVPPMLANGDKVVCTCSGCKESWEFVIHEAMSAADLPLIAQEATWTNG